MLQLNYNFFRGVDTIGNIDTTKVKPITCSHGPHFLVEWAQVISYIRILTNKNLVISLFSN